LGLVPGGNVGGVQDFGAIKLLKMAAS